MTTICIVAATLMQLAARPVALRSGIGVAHDAVTTSSKRAQAFYDQGLAYIHSYVWLEAARSFNQALKSDPNLAMAYAGLTVAYVELNDVAAARDAIARAKALAAQASEREQLWIAARGLQMEAEAAPADAAKRTAYRAALDAALEKFPDDEEFWLARGKAESRDPADRGQGSGAESVRFYEKARALQPTHFAAHHFLAHAYENTGRVNDALAEAATYARMAPNIAHAHHMHGHELWRLGRVDEAIAEFKAADALDTTYMTTDGIPMDLDWHYQHNLDLLGASYEYVGQMKQAEALLKRSFAIPSTSVEQEFNKRAWPMFLRARGRAVEALDAAKTLASHPSPLVSAIGHIEMGEAMLALKDARGAGDEYNTALRLMRGREGAGLLAGALRQLEGGVFLFIGQTNKANDTLAQTVQEVRGRPGPDAWIQATFALDAIAHAAREADDWAFADWVAQQIIEHDPNYAGGHYARALAAEHRGDHGTARAEADAAKRLWSKADADVLALVTRPF